MRLLNLLDGTPIKTPEIVDVSKLGFLDELEYELWFLIEEYFSLFGIEVLGDEPDWATVKGVQEVIISMLANAGVEFKF